MLKLIHTPEGKLKYETNRYSRLDLISLDNEEELLRPWQEYLHRIEVLVGPNHVEYRREAILNYYKRLIKLQCEEIVPLYATGGYFRAGVRYPDGTERTWWWRGEWRTNQKPKSGRIRGPNIQRAWRH